jgi:cytochrome c biogenesis protein CcmG/thiol:disulfide interchange protein DsbE
VRAAFVVVPGLFVALLAFGLLKTTEPKAVVGSPAPDFSLRSLDGTRINRADFAGVPMVVNFWASWCVSCPQEAADLERMWREYGPKGVRFLGVTYDDSVEAARAFVERYGVTYPSVHDPEKRLASGFGVTGPPETFFIDHRGRFAGSESGAQIGSRNDTVIWGPVSAPVLRARIESLLAAWAKDGGARRPPVQREASSATTGDSASRASSKTTQ